MDEIVHLFNFFSLYIVVGVIIRQSYDHAGNNPKKADQRKQPDMPDDCKAKQRAKGANIKAHRCIFWHVDIAIGLFWPFRMALCYPKGVALAHMRCVGKVIKWWWRCCRPFKSSAIPWISCSVSMFF